MHSSLNWEMSGITVSNETPVNWRKYSPNKAFNWGNNSLWLKSDANRNVCCNCFRLFQWILFFANNYYAFSLHSSLTSSERHLFLSEYFTSGVSRLRCCAHKRQQLITSLSYSFKPIDSQSGASTRLVSHRRSSNLPNGVYHIIIFCIPISLLFSSFALNYEKIRFESFASETQNLIDISEWFE